MDNALPAFIAHTKRLYTGDPKGHKDWPAFKAGFDAAQPSVPDGWKLVPKVSTKDMLDAATKYQRTEYVHDEYQPHKLFAGVYWWMVQNSPTPPAAAQNHLQKWSTVIKGLPMDGQAQQDAEKLGAHPVKMPSQSREPILRAMATNYSRGHSWDHLDSDVCLKAADEIRDLRSLLSSQERPDPVMAGDEWLTEHDQLVSDLLDIAEGQSFSAFKALEAKNALLSHARLHVQPASGDDAKSITRLKRIAWLIGSMFAHGSFKAETVNEREIEALLRENGTFWESLEDFDSAMQQGEQP